MSSVDHMTAANTQGNRNGSTDNKHYPLTSLKGYTSFNLCSRCFRCDSLRTFPTWCKNNQLHWIIGLQQVPGMYKTFLFILLLLQYVFDYQCMIIYFSFQLITW